MPLLIDTGTSVRLQVDFEGDGQSGDPALVVCKIKAPNGAVTTYTYGIDVELVRDAIGAYHVDIVLTQTGRYFYRFEGTGGITAAKEDQVVTRQSAFY
jgi:hypothetical protein